jgi:heat shock protein HtpX
MNFIKRIFIFGLVNILIIVTLTIVTTIISAYFGINLHGGTYIGMAVMAAVWGMGGAFISLLLSKYMVKWTMGVKVIDPATHDSQQRQLVMTVHRMAKTAGISKMPEVGIYESPDLNAFATGATKNSSLVAVSTGLLNSMNSDEVEGVLGHEVAHIANGDMVTMTLIQGVVNAFVIFFSRIISMFAASFVKEDMRWIVRLAVTIILEILLSFLGMMVVAVFSRSREFRADKGGAKLAGREKMVAALQALQRHYGQIEGHSNGQQDSLATLKISGKSGGFMALLSTHPALEDRIASLRSGR